jgi:hypothetical protein
MNVLITNARGMNNIEKQRERRELIKKNKASIVGKVCETRSSRRDIANRINSGLNAHRATGGRTIQREMTINMAYQ